MRLLIKNAQIAVGATDSATTGVLIDAITAIGRKRSNPTLLSAMRAPTAAVTMAATVVLHARDRSSVRPRWPAVRR